MAEMSQLLHDDNNNDTKAIEIPQVFLENSQAKTVDSALYTRFLHDWSRHLLFDAILSQYIIKTNILTMASE